MKKSCWVGMCICLVAMATQALAMGGDTCDTATVIPGLPFNDMGDTSTNGINDDYDAACTNTATAPDVVYSFTPSEDMRITISLCESGYDTKLFVFEDNCPPDNTVGEIACADDTCETSAGDRWRSHIESLEITGGTTYYIVVDGYSTNSGPYDLVITRDQEGACCLVNGDCVSLYEDECNEANSLAFHEGQLCAEVSCRQPEPGDNCELPLTFEVPADLPLINSNSTCGHIDDYDDTGLGSYDSGEDLIYEFTVTETTSIQITLDPMGTTWAGFILDSDCPADDTFILSETNGNNSTPFSSDCVELEPGTYYIMVDTNAAPDCIPSLELTVETCVPPVGACCEPIGNCLENVTEAVCDIEGGTWHEGLTCTEADCPQPTPGDNCVLPIQYSVPMDLPISDNNSTCDREDDYNNTALGNYDGGQDIMYQFTVTETTSIRITIDPMTINWIGFVLDDVCPPATAEEDVILRVTNGTEDEPFSSVCLELEPGDYFLMVDTYPSPDCIINFNLTVELCGLLGSCCMEDGTCIDQIDELTCANSNGVAWHEGQVCEETECRQPIPGDNCDIPAPLSLPADLPVSDDNFTCGRYNNYEDTGLENYDKGEDLMYEITITEAVAVQITVDPRGTTYAGFILDDECPASATEGEYILKATNGNNSTPFSSECVELQAGTYYLMIDTFASPDCIPDLNLTIEPCNFYGSCCMPDGSCVEQLTEEECTQTGGIVWNAGLTCAESDCPQPTPGDNCESPAAFSLPADLPIEDDNTTCGRGNNYTETGLGGYDGGEDLIYEFTVTELTAFQIHLDPQDSRWTGFILDDNCPPDNEFIFKETNSTTNGYSTDCFELEAGTYYLMVDTYPAPDCIANLTLSIDPCDMPTGRCCSQLGQQCDMTTEMGCAALDGDWDNTLTCETPCPLPPDNDTCDGAYSLRCGDGKEGTTVNTMTDGAPECGERTPDKEVWYTFTGDGNEVTVQLCESTVDTVMAIYEGTCNGLICVGSNDDSDYCEEKATQSAYTFCTIPNMQYFVAVWDYQANDEIDFIISLDCADPCGYDLAGFADFQACFGSTDSTCLENFDTDDDSDIDLDDFIEFERYLFGPVAK